MPTTAVQPLFLSHYPTGYAGPVVFVVRTYRVGAVEPDAMLGIFTNLDEATTTAVNAQTPGVRGSLIDAYPLNVAL